MQFTGFGKPGERGGNEALNFLEEMAPASGELND